MRALFVCLAILCVAVVQAVAAKSVAYIYGDIAANGTLPSGAAAPYDQMLLTNSGNTGCSQFKAMVEAEGYTISQHYDQTTTLDAAFLSAFDVVVFGLHQKIWSDAEKAALDAWIRAGGGIMMYSDSAAGGLYSTVGIQNPVGQNAVNNVLSAYGMEVTVDQGGGIRAYRPDAGAPNPLIWDQPIFEGEGVSPVAIDPNGDATALIPFRDANKVSGSSISIDARGVTIANPIWAALGHVAVGDGHIIAIFDRQPMWNNGPGSDINEEDNKEILRRVVRYLARDYGNSSEWINFQANGLELSWRRWTTQRNTSIAVQHNTNLVDSAWFSNPDWIDEVATSPESDETEIVIAHWLAPSPTAFARVAITATTNPPPTNPTHVVRAINCGGSAFAGSDGINYEADTLFVGGHSDTFPGNAVAGTTDDLLYNYARSNMSAYNIPITNGSYTVRLKMAETYFTSSNQRVFDTTIEGALVIDNLDLVAVAGQWVAYDLEFPATVSDGVLNIGFSASVNNALINAIVVLEN